MSIVGLGAVRRRRRHLGASRCGDGCRRETWYTIHLYAYLAVALSFAHQLAVGSDFSDDRPGADLVVLALPGGRSAPSSRGGSVGRSSSTSATGSGSAPFGRRPTASCRSTSPAATWTGSAPKPASSSSGASCRAPAGPRPTPSRSPPPPTTGSCASRSRTSATTRTGSRSCVPASRVFAEGPYGTFTADAGRVERVALIAGGIGITPLRALLETLAGGARRRHAALPGGVATATSPSATSSRRWPSAAASQLHFLVGPEIGDDQTDQLGIPALRRARPRHGAARRLRVRSAADARRRSAAGSRLLGVAAGHVHFERFDY